MNKDKYIVFCKESDFYLGDAITSYLRQNNESCEFWYDKIPENGYSEAIKNHNFIAIINPNFVSDSMAVSLVENATLNSLGQVFLLENETIETFPESWGEARYLDATNGLNLNVADTIRGIAQKPIGQVVNIRKEIENIKKAEEERLEKERKTEEVRKEEEKKIFERSYHGINLKDRLVEVPENYPNVRKGLKYLIGDGFPQDEERAFSLFTKAVKENPDDIFASYYYALCIDFNLGKLVEGEDGLKSQFIEKAYKKAADGGITEASLALGSYYMSTNEMEKALGIFNSLTGQNNPKAKYYMGFLAERNREYSEALDLYYDAAEEGIAEAQNALGYMYGEGWGTSVDLNKALQWFKLAAGAGLMQSKYNLAIGYLLGDNPNLKNEAINILKELASDNHSKSIQLLDELRREEQKEKRRQQKKEENEMIKSQLINAGLGLFSHASGSFGLGSRLKDRGY